MASRTRSIIAGAEVIETMDAPHLPGGQLWDLRHGDADDNRTSPYGRGWRKIILSTALEFNYLTATVVFFAIVIVPALLVGLVPPLALAYGRYKLDATATLTSRPVAAVASIAVLIGVALWIGRPLLSMAVDSLWHLHYTFVFPLFVGLRETISAVIERLPGETRASASLDRRRRIGTILAALLLATGSLSLALALGVPKVRGIGYGIFQPWDLAAAAVTNALILVSLSTVGASLFWMMRELTSLKPLRDWAPGPPPGGSAVVRVAHLSDLHIVGERYGYRMECGTLGPAGNGSMHRALERLSRIHASTPLDCVLVTGDVTDAGTRAEWVEFVDMLRTVPDLRARTLFVPGNHDVNIVDRNNTGRFDLPWSVGHALRRLRFLVALDEIQGEHLHLVDPASGAPGPSLRAHLQDGDRPARLRELAELGTWRGRREVGKVWDDVFPLVLPGKRDGCGVILLDSNARSHFSATNAIGVIGRSELKKLRAILNASPDRPWIILLHHHVVEYPVGSVKIADRIALSLMNAPTVLSTLARHASHVVIFHGHRHHDWIGTKGEVVLCSAPSVALGSAGPELYRGSFHINELALGAGGTVTLASSQRVMVA